MSFSSEVKEELSKLNNLAKKEVVKFELLGYLMTNHVALEEEKTKKQNLKLKFSTENEYNINRFSKLLSNLQLTNHEIQIVGKTFSISLPIPELEEVKYSQKEILIDLKKIEQHMENREDLQKALIRGSFLGGGSISNPKSNYHLEIIFSQIENIGLVSKILENYDIHLKTLLQKQNVSLYAKEGEEISKYLAFIGANQSVLKFEDIRVYREIRNNVNRKVNCETANLNKTVNSALKQIQDIQYLKEKKGLDKLSKSLQEMAKVRVLHPEASLLELGELLTVKLGKSGVNHRLKALENIAEELRKNE